jgi:hypothetical protein
MADTNVLQDFLSQLGTLSDEPTSYWENYETSATPNIPLDPGLYVLRIPAVGNDFKPGKTRPDKDNKVHFQYELDNVPVVVPEGVNRKVKYLKTSVKRSPFRSGSLAGDLVLHTGSGLQPKNNQEWLGAMPQLAGQEFGVELELQVYDSEAKKPVYNKAAELLKNADGSYKTRYVYKNGTLIQNPEDEAKAVKDKKENAPGSTAIKVLYASNQLVRILNPEEVRKLRGA